MKIIIDSREKGRIIKAKEYYEEEGYEVEVQTLEAGDYVFNDKVVFEYKTINDFINSLKNESLFNEAANQAQRYPYHYIIITGDARTYCENNWNWERKKYNNNYKRYMLLMLGLYTGTLRRLRTFTTPIIVKDEEEAFEEMLQQAQKCLDGLTDAYANVTRPVPSQNPAMVLLCSCRGISTKRAKRIINHFQIKSLEDLLNVKNFYEVKGIGQNTAKNIYKFIHKKD